MCIAVYKEAGQPVQKKKVYKRCFRKNPDGAGYAWYNEGKGVWVVRKGLMSFKKFWKAFNTDNNKINFTGKKLLVHFRVGTSGNRKGPDCTHPFPVSADLDDMRALQYETDRLVAHNGVVGPGCGTASDTMIAIRDHIDLLWDLLYDKDKEKRATALLEELLEIKKCRWFIANKDDVTLFGTWSHSYEYDSKFSNRGYLPDTPLPPALPGLADGAAVDNDSPFVPPQTQRFVRQGDYSMYCDQQGEWSWDLWKEGNKQHYVYKDADKDVELSSPNETHDYLDSPASVMALVDKDGNILWDDDYEPTKDLAQCPSCFSEDLTESGYIHGEMGCLSCGCVFEADTGNIVLFDPSICEDMKIYMKCETCGEQVQIDQYGECPHCGTILDAELAERRIKEQINAK